MDRIAQALRENDMYAYQVARYDLVPDGEAVILENEQFVDTDFAAFNLGFFVFNHCDLRGARHLAGQPITFINCDARGIDFTDTQTIIHAKDSDFRGLVLDDNTIIANTEGEVSSSFQDCVFDEDMTQRLEALGASITTGS